MKSRDQLLADLVVAIDANDKETIDELVGTIGILPTFQIYAETQRKVPSNELYSNYIEELKQLMTGDLTSYPLLTLSEKECVMSRKRWNDIVSDIDRVNDQHRRKFNLAQLIQNHMRLCGYENVEALYTRAINYLKDNSAIVVSFNARIFAQGLAVYQLQNMFETPTHKSHSYETMRQETEDGFFSSLSADIKTSLVQDIHARPRYGALVLLDKNHPISPTLGYGKSYVLLRDIVKHNSLFLRDDSYNNKFSYLSPENKGVTGDLMPCTYHHLDILFLGMGTKKFKSIIDWALFGILSRKFNHAQSYIEVLLPPINFLDPTLVEHIHIDKDELDLDKNILDNISALGIKVTKDIDNPYDIFLSEFFACIENNMLNRLSELLSISPRVIPQIVVSNSLHISAYQGNAVLVKLLISHGADVKATNEKGWNAFHMMIMGGHFVLLREIYNDRKINELYILKDMYDVSIYGYKTNDPFRIQALNNLTSLYDQLLQSDQLNRSHIFLGCIEYESRRAMQLHTDLFFKWKKKSALAERLDNVKQNFLSYLENKDFSADYFVDTYSEYIQKIIQNKSQPSSS